MSSLIQMFANLITNAGKYTPSGGRIEVSARREDDNAGDRHFRLGHRTGGEQLERIFEMFAQVEPGIGRQHRPGDRISLVKSLVEFPYGGEITAASRGTGSG
ncbi:MAG: ATP-binding protein [Pirellulaceae bacterium]